MSQINEKHIHISGSRSFWVFKRIFDIVISIFLMPALFLTYVLLLIFNNFFNRGPVFFTQYRMGKDCNRFKAIKFRSMISSDYIIREYDDPIEIDRITPLGNFLRKARLDELPQIINVFKGEMSLIGPRPDYYEHALMFVENIPGYRDRHIIRPGISGLSQIRLGYAEGIKATQKKSTIDMFYIKNASFTLDFRIVLATIFTIFMGRGI
jgi:lipopolysaccharide/colanic/teichoic acid biosynthesis glycosyltransferase